MNTAKKLARLSGFAVIVSSLGLAVLANSANAVEAPPTLTFKELKKGSTFHFVDIPPMATLKHGVASFSPGDQIITTNPLAMEGRTVGKIRVICTATTPGSTKSLASGGFDCNGIAKLPGGHLILVGEAGNTVTEGAITGGTGVYTGARGSFVSKPGRGGSTNTVTLVE
jgi:hypothetical protein